mgnify:FL=1
MKISTKGRYALRTMIDLAMNDTGENISIKAIAARQGISTKYLEQIISTLNKAGYVKSERGANGGYRLTKKPEEYTGGMILRLTEGSLAITTCTQDEQNLCERYGCCTTVKVWEKINKAISDVVDNITIADLAADEQNSTNNFVI